MCIGQDLPPLPPPSTVPGMEITITLKLDSAVAQWLNNTLTHTTPEELASTIFTAHLVDEGAPVPSRYGVGREDFLRAADCALDDFSPLEPFVKGRRKRVASAVAEAFTGEG